MKADTAYLDLTDDEEATVATHQQALETFDERCARIDADIKRRGERRAPFGLMTLTSAIVVVAIVAALVIYFKAP